MHKFILIFLLFNVSTLSFAETQLTLSPSLLRFDYSEFSQTNRLLDREIGWLPGLETKLRYPLTSKLLFDVYASYYRGSVYYVGESQTLGAFGVTRRPLNTDTRTSFIRLGARLELVTNQNLHLFLSAQSHHWQRDIKDTDTVSGLDETYRWMEYSVGFNSNLFIRDKDALNIEAGLLMTRQASIFVDLSKVDYGSTTLDLGDSTGARFSFLWRQHFKENFRYGVNLFFEAWQFGRSIKKRTEGGAFSASFEEPRSKTRNIGLKLNLEYRFQ